MMMMMMVLILTARLAQSVEHETLNLRVLGSSPKLGDIVVVLAAIWKERLKFLCDDERYEKRHDKTASRQ